MKGRIWARRAAAALAVMGLALFAAAAVMEARDYPWGLLFGRKAQTADSVPDPSPVVLDEEDSGAVVVSAEPYGADASPDIPSSSPEHPSPSPDAALPGDESVAKKAESPSKYVVLGILKIPAIRVSQNILEGTDRQLKYGVGHAQGTAMPGQEGNCAIAGHRSRSFRYLDKLREGDLIHIKTGATTFTYAVCGSFEVLPDEVWVLEGVEDERYALTLITCTPYMTWSRRLIVRARLVEVDGQPFSPPSPPDASGTPDPGQPSAPDGNGTGGSASAQAAPSSPAESAMPEEGATAGAENAQETPFPSAIPPA